MLIEYTPMNAPTRSNADWRPLALVALLVLGVVSSGLVTAYVAIDLRAEAREAE